MNSRLIAWVSGILTLLLVTFSFIISYQNLVALATEKGIPVPGLFPWVVEFAVIAFSVQVLRRSMQGEQPVWGWVLVIGSSLAAGAFNVIHAQDDLVSQTMHAIPSVFMLLSFETFLGQLKESAQRSHLFKSLDSLHTDLAALAVQFEQEQADLEQRLTARRQALDAEIEQRQASLSDLEQQLAQARDHLTHLHLALEQAQRRLPPANSLAQARGVQTEQVTITIEHRRTELVHLLLTEGDIGASALADRLNTSRGTVYNDLKALTESGVVFKDNSGWAVNKAALPALLSEQAGGEVSAW